MELSLTSDSDLVQLCKAADREAWNEFFRRFMPLIKSTITHRLSQFDSTFTHQRDDLLDIESEIMESLVVKLYPKGILDQLGDPSGVRPWLKVVVSHLTLDWLKNQGRLKHAVRREIERGMRSLDEPLGNDTDITLADTIPVDRPERTRELRDCLDALLRHAGRNLGHRDYWIVRLSLISEIPLDEDEEEALTDFSPLPPDSCRNLITECVADVERRVKERDAKLGLAICLASEQRRLQYALNGILHDDTPAGISKANQLRQDILRLDERRRTLLEEGAKIPRPRNAEISSLVGIDHGQESYVTTILKRSRGKLASIFASLWEDDSE